MHTNVPSAALRPLAIKLSCLRRIPSREATIEYAVTTHARAKANWPSCAMLVALSYAGCGFFFVFRGALGLHFIRDEHTVTAKLAFDHGLRPIDKCIWRGIVTDVLYGEFFHLFGFLVLLADDEIDGLALPFNRSRHHVSSDLQPARVCLILGSVKLRNRLVVRITFLETRVRQIGESENDDHRAHDKLKLFAFHGFTPLKYETL